MTIDLILGAVIGMVLGFVGAFLFKKIQGDDSKKIRALEEEHNKYRKQVDDHFVNTAVLFKGLTDQYRDVYQHIASGAGELCSEEAKANQIDLQQTVLLTASSDFVGQESAVEDTNLDESPEQEQTEAAVTDDEDDVPLAVEAEVPVELAEKLKSQAGNKNKTV